MYAYASMYTASLEEDVSTRMYFLRFTPFTSGSLFARASAVPERMALSHAASWFLSACFIRPEQNEGWDVYGVPSMKVPSYV